MGQMFFPDEDQYGNVTHTKRWERVLLSIICTMLIGGGVYWLLDKYDVFSSNKNTMYVIAEGLNLREDKGTRSDIITFADYGEHVKVLSRDETIWANVKYNDNEGYMSLKGLAPKEDFNRLDAIWGDDNIRGEVYDLRDRASLLSFARKSSITNYFKLYSVENGNRNYWSYSLGGTHIFAFILCNMNTNERCAAIYSYKDGKPVCELGKMSITHNQGIDVVILTDEGYKIMFGQNQ